MKKQFLNMFVAISLVCGGFLFSSCDKEDSENTPIENSNVNQVKSATQQVSAAWSNMTFSELQPLNNAIKMRSAKAGDRSSSIIDEYRNRIEEYLHSLLPETSEPREYEREFTLPQFNENLSATWNLVGYIITPSQSDNNTYNHNEMTGTYEIVVDDTTTYLLVAESIRDISFNRSSLESENCRVLTIYLNNEEVVRTVVTRSMTFGTPFALETSIAFLGEIHYQGNLITLTREAIDANSAKYTVTFSQNATEMVKITAVFNAVSGTSMFNKSYGCVYNVSLLEGTASIAGEIPSISDFVSAGMEVLPMLKEGASQADCAAATAALNDAVSVEIFLSNSRLGTSTLGAVLDEETNLYKPGILIASPLWDNNSLTIPQILEVMGLSMQDLLDLINGQN